MNGMAEPARKLQIFLLIYSTLTSIMLLVAGVLFVLSYRVVEFQVFEFERNLMLLFM